MDHANYAPWKITNFIRGRSNKGKTTGSYLLSKNNTNNNKRNISVLELTHRRLWHADICHFNMNKWLRRLGVWVLVGVVARGSEDPHTQTSVILIHLEMPPLILQHQTTLQQAIELQLWCWITLHLKPSRHLILLLDWETVQPNV